MNKYVFSVLYLSACGGMAPETLPSAGQAAVALPQVETAQETPNACLYAWKATSAAWATKFDLSAACQHLDATIELVVRPLAEMPCPGAAGCWKEGVIYIREDLSHAQASAAAVHEWVHALSCCENGSADADHENSALWVTSDPTGAQGDTVEAVASRAVPNGPCLGDK